MVLSVPANPLVDISNNGASASSHTPKLIEKGRGSHTWDLYGDGTSVFVAGGQAGTQVWDGNSWTDYILNDLGNNNFEVSTGLISTKFSGTETQHWSANMTNQVATEDYVIAQSQGVNWNEFETTVQSRVSGITSEAKIKEIRGINVTDSVESVRITENSTLDIGNLVTLYDFVESEPLKHTFEFTKQTSGTDTYRFYHNFYLQINEIELESITNDETKTLFGKLKIKSGEIEMNGEKTTTVTLDKATYGEFLQSVEFRNLLTGDLVLGEIVAPDPSHPSWDDFIELQIDASQSPVQFTFVYGEWTLSQNESFVLDPDTYSSGNPITDGFVQDSDNNDVCDVGVDKFTTGNGALVGVNDSDNSTDCDRMILDYDISEISTGVSVDDVDITFEVRSTGSRGCDIVSMGTTRVSDTASNIFTAISGGTVMINDSAECETTGSKSIDLTDTGNSEVQSRVTAGDGFFTFAIKEDNETLDSSSAHRYIIETEESTPAPTLTIVYTNPVPSAPSNPTALTNSTTQMLLDWDDPDSADNVTGARIYNATDGSIFLNDTGTSISKHQISGLTSGTEYPWIVALWNATGLGANSTQFSNQTLTDAPTISSANTGESWMNIIFSISGTFNGVGVDCESPTGNGFSTVIGNTSNTDTNYNYTGLTGGASGSTQYNCKISAHNLGGTSSFSSALANYTLGLLNAPTINNIDRINQTAFRISLTEGDGLPDATGYQVKRKPISGGGFDVAINDTESTSTTITDSGLTTGAHYIYQIFAWNSYGTSNGSNQVQTGTGGASLSPGGGSTLSETFEDITDILFSSLKLFSNEEKISFGEIKQLEVLLNWNSTENLIITSVDADLSEAPEFEVIPQKIGEGLTYKGNPSASEDTPSKGIFLYKLVAPKQRCTANDTEQCSQPGRYEIAIEFTGLLNQEKITKSVTVPVILEDETNFGLITIGLVGVLVVGSVVGQSVYKSIKPTKKSKGSSKSKKKAVEKALNPKKKKK